jgi:arylsulfatase A-like enzyme
MAQASSLSFTAAVRRFLRLVLLCAGIGAATGCAWAAARGLMHGSFDAGFWKTVYVNARSDATRIGVIGAALGAALGCAVVVSRLVVPSPGGAPGLERHVDRLRARHGGPWPYALILACGLAAAVAAEFISGNSYVLFGVVLSALFLCVLLGFSRLAARLARESAASRVGAFLAGLYAGVVHLFVVGLALAGYAYDPKLKHVFVHYILHSEFIAAALALFACSVLVFFMVRSHVRVSSVGGPRFGTGFFVAVLLVAVTFLAWAHTPLAGRFGYTAGNPKNVVLIGIDTLRHDHTTLFEVPAEGEPDVTPNLRRLASRGTVFTRAVSQAPWTMPSFASVLTGKYPADHGADSTAGKMRGGQVTIAEVLKEAGYSTGAVMGTFFVTSIRGFDQGFDFFNEDYNLGYWPLTSEGVTDLSIEFIERNRDRRFFLFTHYYDPHFAYRDHPDLDFTGDYDGWLKGNNLGLDGLLQQRQDLSEADIKYLVDSYDEEIAYTDGQIGRILDIIEELGLAGDTAVIVVADHGEEFMERGWIGHSATLHHEQIHVPLVMSLPGLENAEPVVSGTVETRAIFPTILDYVDVPWEMLDPPSLLPLVRGGAGGGSESGGSRRRAEAWAFTGHMRGERRLPKLLSMQTDRWKFVMDRQRERNFLFDLENDSQELNNVIDAHPEVAEEMLGRLNAWMDELGERPRPPGDWDDISTQSDMLKKLGY